MYGFFNGVHMFCILMLAAILMCIFYHVLLDPNRITHCHHCKRLFRVKDLDEERFCSECHDYSD